VYADASTYIALANAMINWHHGSVQCMSGKDLVGYDFLSVSKDEFGPLFVKSASEARLDNIVFQ
jgi:hypothetical protein